MGDVIDLAEGEEAARLRKQAAALQNREEGKYGNPRGRLTRAQKRHAIITMLLAGGTTAEIAAALNTTASSVSKIINRVLEEWETEDRGQVDKVRELQVKRIDSLIQSLWSDAKGAPKNPGDPARRPDLRAIGEIRKLEALKARIVGTEAAKRVEVGGSVGFHIDAGEVNELERAWAAGGKLEGEVVSEQTLPAGASGDS